MALFAIADLHLSVGGEKSMDVFGGKWENYMKKLRENWLSLVSPEDTVVIPGDVSWAMYLEELREDFSFLNALPGRKILLKGNHDYWWTTMNKMKKYLDSQGFGTIDILHNESRVYNGVALCGSRGYTLPTPKTTPEDIRIFEREKQRLEISLEHARKAGFGEIIVFLHYPPRDRQSGNAEFVEIMKRYPVKRCIFGHLHGDAHQNAVLGSVEGIEMLLASCDYLDFVPLKILD